jgi:ribonuclease HI
VVRWLGIYFDSKLTFKAYIEKKVNSATQAFYKIQRLSNTQQGLGFAKLKLLYNACINSIADYGVQLWWKGTNQSTIIKPYKQLHYQGVSKVLGAFRGSPAKALELEASLPPPEIRFQKACTAYGLRTLLFPASHPITKALIEPTKDELAPEDTDTGALAAVQPNTQLQKLLTQIKSLTEGNWNVEKIRAKWQPPWAAEAKAIIVITKNKKAKAKIAHEKLVRSLLQDPFEKPILAYTDGSQGEYNGKITNGAGVYMQQAEGPTISKSWNLGEKIEVADAEVIAIVKALEITLQQAEYYTQLYLFNDSQAAIQKVQNNHSFNSLKARELICQISQKATVNIHWVPSHVEVQGNEIADKLAKQGLKRKPQNTFTSISYLRRKARAKILAGWLNSWETARTGKGNHYQKVVQDAVKPTLKPTIPKLPRKLQSAYIQLKTGIGYQKAHQAVIGNAVSPFCNRCNGGYKQTAAHLILRCIAYEKERKEMKKALRLPDSLQVLFCTKAGKEALAKFLISTEICTASWLQGET